MKTLFVTLSLMLMSFAANAQVTSVTFEPNCNMKTTVLSGDELIEGLTPERAKAAKDYNEIARNKIRGMCPIKVISVKSADDQTACSFVGDVQVMNFDAKKYVAEQVKNCSSPGCLPQVTLCRGRVHCEDDPKFKTGTYNVTCPGNDGDCPDVYTCMNDEYTSPKKDIKEAIMNGKPAKAGQQ